MGATGSTGESIRASIWPQIGWTVLCFAAGFAVATGVWN